ncbi:hypothetical protein ACTMU2_00430 [Cupriavidus basilensis]
MGDDLLLLVAEEAGEVIGGALFTLARRSGIMQYHLSGSDWDYRHRQPTKIIIHTARGGAARMAFRGCTAGGEARPRIPCRIQARVLAGHACVRHAARGRQSAGVSSPVGRRRRFHGRSRLLFPAYRRPRPAKTPAGSRRTALALTP